MLVMEQVRESARRLVTGSVDDLPPHYRQVVEAGAKAELVSPERLMRNAGRELLSDIESAVRFRIEPRASEMLIDMAVLPEQRKRLAASARYLFLPAPVTWFELDHPEPSQRFAALARADSGDLRCGKVTIWNPIEDGSRYETFRVPFDLRSRVPVWVPHQDDPWLRHIMRHNSDNPDRDVTLDANALGAFLLAVLAFLCSPSAWVPREVAFEKLNASRQRKGKWPLMAYSEVLLRVTGPAPTVTPATGKGPERALHFVRAHLRVRCTGRVELVRPHWRGNAELGIKRPAYAVVG